MTLGALFPIIASRVHQHLPRLKDVWERQPVYFITVCTAGRKPRLASPTSHEILRDEFAGMHAHYGWAVGRYVVMPDHVHFFVMSSPAPKLSLSGTIGKWKEWTSKKLVAEQSIAGPVWQPQFFDHLLRNSESRSEKWDYVRNNPVRAGLVSTPELWPFAGSIDFE